MIDLIREKKDGCNSYNEIYAKYKKMRVKQMVEVKNTYEIMGVEQTVDLTEEKKMGVKRMVELKNAYKNNGCWMNGRFDRRKKDKCKTNSRSEKCIWK